jgi:hypothetical protein
MACCLAASSRVGDTSVAPMLAERSRITIRLRPAMPPSGRTAAPAQRQQQQQQQPKQQQQIAAQLCQARSLDIADHAVPQEGRRDRALLAAWQQVDATMTGQ